MEKDTSTNKLPLIENKIELERPKERKISASSSKKFSQEQIFLNGIDRSPVELKPVKKVKVIDKYFDSIGYSKYQYVQIFIASLVNIVIGAESLIPNLIVVQIQREMKVELYQAAMLVAAFGLGAGVGMFFYIYKNLIISKY